MTAQQLRVSNIITQILVAIGLFLAAFNFNQMQDRLAKVEDKLSIIQAQSAVLDLKVLQCDVRLSEHIGRRDN